MDAHVWSSSDAYRFSGEVTEFTAARVEDLSVYVDGRRVDPGSFQTLPNTLTVSGTGSSPKAYQFAVSGDVRGAGNLNPDDTVRERSVDAHVWSSSDTYEFSGEITSLDVESPADVTVVVNGVEVDPADIGSQSLPNRLVVDGTKMEGRATYTFEVSEAVEPSTALGPLESNDEISGTTVEGAVGDYVDCYRFAGDLTSMHVDGAAVVTIERGLGS